MSNDESSVTEMIALATGRCDAWGVVAVTVLLLVGCDERSQPVPIPSSRPARVVGDVESDAVTFTGRIYPQRYNRLTDRSKGHHAIVWQYGTAAPKALIEADEPDVDIQERLEKNVGLVPGNNLQAEAWTRVRDRNHPEPDRKVAGPELSVSVSWAGLDEPIPLHELFINTQPTDVRIRFGGHLEFTSLWKSGCVVCLFSCPGGRTSNAAYTLREQVFGQRSFVADESRLPPDGTAVEVTLTPIDASTTSLPGS